MPPDFSPTTPASSPSVVVAPQTDERDSLIPGPESTSGPAFSPTPNSQLQILPRDPASLRVHPALKLQPGWAEDDPRFEALCDDIAARGIIEPLKITPDGQIVDGRHRWRAARRMQLTSVPCLVTEYPAAEIALRTLIHRRHYTKGQLAYLAYPLTIAAFEEAQKRRSMNALKNESDSVGFVFKTVEDWAKDLDVSRDLLEQARKIHQQFELHPDWQAEDEPKILDAHDPVGLGHVLSGFAGRLHTKGKDRPPPDEDRQLLLFQRAIMDLGNRYDYWEKFQPEQKRTVIQRIDTAIGAMPEDLLTEWNRRSTAELKRRKSAPAN